MNGASLRRSILRINLTILLYHHYYAGLREVFHNRLCFLSEFDLKDYKIFENDLQTEPATYPKELKK